ncbi:MAG: type II toxin-antitoxin system RelE/ParE family toxin [Methylococcaceae bacterium]
MMWKVKFSAKAEKTLKRLDSITKRRIESFVDDLIITNNPRLQGLALQGDLKGLWRYRVGDYRLVCQINDGELIVLVVEIGHRSVVYH